LERIKINLKKLPRAYELRPIDPNIKIEKL